MSFFGRVFKWVADKFIVEALSKNKGFQNFAVRTHHNVQKMGEKTHSTVESAQNNSLFSEIRQVRDELKSEIGEARAQIRKEWESEVRKMEDEVHKIDGKK